jgi:hypothetical protein
MWVEPRGPPQWPCSAPDSRPPPLCWPRLSPRGSLGLLLPTTGRRTPCVVISRRTLCPTSRRWSECACSAPARPPHDAALAPVAVAGNEAEVGQWGPVADWPVVGIHVALLENGKVLAYDTVNDTQTEPHDGTRATVWDPATGAHTPVNVTTTTSSAAAWRMARSSSPAATRTPQNDGVAQTHNLHPDINSWTVVKRA